MDADVVNDERALVQRAVRRDAEAFARLYDHFVDKIFKYIYYKVRTTSQAEELTSQVFLKAWESIGSYRWTERPFAAWLYRIAHNLVVDYFRTHHQAVSLEDLSITDDNADVDQAAVKHLDAEMVREAITKLTDEQQQVIILKFLEGYETEEIAQLLEKEPGAVRSLQHRALIALQKIVKK